MCVSTWDISSLGQEKFNTVSKAYHMRDHKLHVNLAFEIARMEIFSITTGLHKGSIVD